MSDFITILSQLADGKSLSRSQAEDAFDILMKGEADESQIAAFLTALRVRGETVDEIIGGATVMRKHMDRISAPDNALDIVGTGGSGLNTYNISTAACFITAAAGIPIAKHGNRAASSKSGTADALEALGGTLEIGFENVEKALAETGFTFLFARAHHSAMRHVAPVRMSLKFKTIFNLLGPLSSPAQAKYQLLGVFDRKWLKPLAETLREMGSKRVMVVHGSDGMDEITTTGTTFVAELKDGDIREYEISPADAGLETAPLGSLEGGSPEHNASAIRKLFDGEPSPFRDISLINAGAALMIGDKVSNIADGVTLAAELVDSGKAKAVLQDWITFTQHAKAKA